jgi:hypothetical protein
VNRSRRLDPDPGLVITVAAYLLILLFGATYWRRLGYM